MLAALEEDDDFAAGLATFDGDNDISISFLARSEAECEYCRCW